MKVTLVPSSVAHSGQQERQYLTSYLLNDTVAIDAGSIGLYCTPQEQVRIKNVLITHTHIDHVASLALFVENVYEAKDDCVTIHGGPEVLDSLQRDIFNDRLWPNFIAMSNPKRLFLRTATLDAGKPVEVDGLRITPVPVNHVVPTFGFLIEDDRSAIVLATDTGPTDEIWRYANANPKLKAVLLEATFPNAMQWLADVSLHLTPATFLHETKKLARSVPILVMHLKPRFHSEVVRELGALNLPHVSVMEYGKAYTF